MKSLTTLLVMSIALLFLQSCASYKPNDFDNQTRRYNDYRRNYSIEILDGYSLLSKDASSRIKTAFFKDGPRDTVIFFNKENESLLGMWAREITLKDFHNNRNEAISSLAEHLEESCNSTAECKDIKILITDNSVSAEVDVVGELGDGKGINTSTFSPLSKDQSRSGFFALLGISKSENFETLKEDYVTMLDSLQFPAFSEEQRKQD